jgi:hypothetical protein
VTNSLLIFLMAAIVVFSVFFFYTGRVNKLADILISDFGLFRYESELRNGADKVTYWHLKAVLDFIDNFDPSEHQDPLVHAHVARVRSARDLWHVTLAVVGTICAIQMIFFQ